jgi:hypothetical protein
VEDVTILVIFNGYLMRLSPVIRVIVKIGLREESITGVRVGVIVR